MKFAGELRIPEVDHPGIPASVLVEDTQIEIVLDGESIGRWSLFDVRARRLISKAFALDLAGEEVVFLAEEPVDFAYRGVEHMAQIWAQLKSMRGPQRMMAVRKSRAGTKVSRVEELREAMEANLKARLAQPKSREAEPEPAPEPTRPPPNRAPKDSEPALESVPAVETVPEDPPAVEPDPEVEHPVEEAEAEVALAPDTDVLDDGLQGVQEPVEETDRTRFERLQAEAAARDQRRIEVFRSEMGKLEAERAEADRVESERAELFRKEMDRLKAEMRALKAAEAEASAQGVDQERSRGVQAEIDRIEESRLQLERMEAERLAADQRRREAAQARRAELERQEAERWEAQRREMDRLRAEATAIERTAAARRAAAEAAAARAVFATAEAAPEEPSTNDKVESGAEQSGAADPDVDSSAPQEQDSASTATPGDPAGRVEAAPKERGLLGAVKGAFSRGATAHEHDFVTAPGSLGISRSICTECGFVSIGTSDE